MYSRFTRFCFVVSAFLIAAMLMLMSPGIQSGSGAGTYGVDQGSPLANLQFNLGTVAVSVRSGLQSAAMSVVNAITYVPRHVASFVVHATDVRAFIKPADAMQVPVIEPIKNIATVSADPIATVAPAAPPPAPAPPAALARPAVTTVAASLSAPSAGNRYARGNCTWWVFQRRAQVGHAIPNNWGNAATWASRAARDGYAVDHTPNAGSIMQTRNSAGGLGHVAYVEQVNSDGSWYISEMNVVGFGVVSHRTMPPSATASYNFIHDQ